MGKFEKAIGDGGIWTKQGQRGEYLSFRMTFPVNGSVPIQVDGVAFKNDKKTGNQPDYKVLVNSWKYPEPRKDYPKPAPEPEKPREDEQDIPF